MSESAEFVMKSAVLSLMGKLQVSKAAGLLPTQPGVWVKGAGTVLESEITYSFPPEGPCSLDPTKPLHKPLYEAGLRHVFYAQQQVSTQALLMVGEKFTKTELTDEEIEYCNLLSGLVANALSTVELTSSLKRESSNLERSNQLLLTLFDVSREFNSLNTSEEIIRVLTYRLLGQLTVSKFSLVLFDNNDTAELVVDRLKLKSTSKLSDVFCDLNSAISMSDADGLKSQYLKYMIDHQAQLAVPLIVKSRRTGILFLGRRMVDGKFTDADIKFIESLGSVATTALENNRLLQQELKQKALEEELAIAKKIQQGLLPRAIPSIEGYDIAASNLSSKEIGGDYYDISLEHDGDIMFIIADVSGKGVPAALLMANMQAAFRTLAPLGLPLEVMVERMNSLIFRNTTSDKFVTAFIGVLTPKSGVLKYINAGHNPPVIVREDNSVEELTHGGLILGIMEHTIPYEVGRVVLRHNELLYLYTDGVSEAQNREGAELGEKPLIALLQEKCSADSATILAEVDALVHSHVQSEPQSDDITMMAFRRV